MASDYLLQHAAQDELVYVPGFADREALTFTIGHRVLFCCVLDEDSPLPPATVESLGAYLVTKGTTPDWIVLFGKLRDEYWNKVQARYAIAAQPKVFFYPTQRPELNAHAFMPLPAGESGVHILQRRPEHRLQEEAAALLRRKRYAEALARYREALVIAPDYVQALAGMGEALLRLQRYEEALAALALALALQPKPALSGVLQRLMGRAALESGRDQAAAAHLESALQLDPRDAAALDHLALVRSGQQRHAAALELYRRLVELTPDSAQTHANIGAALYYLDRVDEAVRSFEHVLSLEPTLETARTALDGIRKSLPREAP